MPLEVVTPGPSLKVVAQYIPALDAYMQAMILASGAEGEEEPFAAGRPDDIVVVPTIDAGSYGAGDNLDGDLLSYVGATLTGQGWIDVLWVVDDDKQISAGVKDLEIYFLASAITPDAQNALFDLSYAESQAIRACISTANGATYDVGGATWTVVEPGRPIPFSVASGTTLPAVVKVVDAATWTATTSLQIGIHVIRA